MDGAVAPRAPKRARADGAAGAHGGDAAAAQWGRARARSAAAAGGASEQQQRVGGAAAGLDDVDAAIAAASEEGELDGAAAAAPQQRVFAPDDAPVEHHARQLAAVRAYHAAEGRWPPSTKSAATLELTRADGGVDVLSVRQLGMWLATRKGEHKRGALKHPGVLAFALEQGWPGPGEEVVAPPDMASMLAAVRAYHAAEGRWPSQTKSAATLELARADGGVDVLSVRQLGQWLKSRKGEHKRGALQHPGVLAFALEQGWPGP